MKKTLLIASLLLVLVACNKNQKAVRKLDGSWIVTKYQISDGTQTLDYVSLFKEIKFTFENCKLKKNETCTGTIEITDLNGTVETSTEQYLVKDDGNVLQFNSSPSADDYKIDELTRTKLILSKTDNDGTLIYEFKKQ